MADQNSPTKARLMVLDAATTKGQPVAPGTLALEVDFNPQSLKLTYQNKTDGGKTAKPSESQFVGRLDASLALELVFDTTQNLQAGTAGQDVRQKTQKIFQLLLPKDSTNPKSAPPIVRFEWGTFLFEGMIKSMNETLEYFASEGIPLRSTVALTISTTTDLLLFNNSVQKKPATDFARTPPGTQPQTQLPPGQSLQKAAGLNGDSADWRGIAAANNVDNPLRPPSGQPLTLSASAGAGVSIGAGASAGIGGNASVGLSAGGGAGAQVGFSAGIGGGVGFAAGASAGLSLGASASAGVGAGASFGASASAGASFGASASAGASFGASASAGASFGASAGVSGGTGAGIGASASAGASIGGSTNATTAGSNFGIGTSLISFKVRQR